MLTNPSLMETRQKLVQIKFRVRSYKITMKTKTVKWIEPTSIKPTVNMLLANLECRRIICKEEVKAITKASWISKTLNKCMGLPLKIGISNKMESKLLHGTVTDKMAACRICKILRNKDSSSSAKLKVCRHRTRQITRILNINYRSRSSKVCHLLANTNRIIKLLMGLIIHQQQWEIQPKEGSIIKNLKTSTSVMVQLTDRWK